MSTNTFSDNSQNRRSATGGCHCGLIRYKAILDMGSLQPTKCNCSYCHKTNFLDINIDADNDEVFEFLLSSSSNADKGQSLGQYVFGPKDVIWSFCKVCGVTILAQGKLSGSGKKVRMLNAVTLDQGQEGLDFSKIKIRYYNGRDHAWDAQKQDEPAEFGTW